MLNVDLIEISDEQAQGAKLLASGFSEPSIRKRGMIDMLGISCAVNYLTAKRFRIDTRRSVYKIPLLFEEFKITDIYYGNYRIDVITLFKEKTVKIPRIHVDMDIMPHFYFIVQIGAKIKEAKMIGFIESKKILACSHDSKYYYPPLDLIVNCSKFASYTNRSVATKTLLGKHVDCIGLFLKFMDKELSTIYKRQLIQHIMNCDGCRARFIEVAEFEKLAKNIRYYPDLMRKAQVITQAADTAEEYITKPKVLNLQEQIENSDFENKAKGVVILEDGEEFTELKNGNTYDNDNDVSLPQTSVKPAPKTIDMFDLSDKSNSNVLSTKVIDLIFNKIPKFEMPSITVITDAKHRRKLMISILILFVVLSFMLISYKGSDGIDDENAKAENLENLENFEDPFEISDNEYSYGGRQIKLLPREKNIEQYSIEQPKIQDSSYSPTVAKISWEAPESVTKKDSYKKFLMLAGKNIKLNLQNDLLLVNDIPTAKAVKLDIKIASSGEVQLVKVISSSGSDQIDAAAKKVVSETLSYLKPPSHGIISHPVSITLSAELQ